MRNCAYRLSLWRFPDKRRSLAGRTIVKEHLLGGIRRRTRPGAKITCAVGPTSFKWCKDSKRGFSIPWVTINTGLRTPDGREVLLTEYFCDHSGCPNIATRPLGCVKELGLVAVVCDEHAPNLGPNSRFLREPSNRRLSLMR